MDSRATIERFREMLGMADADEINDAVEKSKPSKEEQSCNALLYEQYMKEREQRRWEKKKRKMKNRR